MCEVKGRDIIPSEEEVTSFFQPILSLQSQKIIGYEALGRRIVGDRVISLGPFFQNPSIDDEQHLRIDRILREKAMRHVAQFASGPKLFINLKPSWIYRMIHKIGELPTLRFIRESGLDPSQVVIEITEEEFVGHLEELTSVIELYRQKGCLIAIDDIGSGYSNYDRIASIKPHILKVDLKFLKKSSVHEGYNAVLKSFSILAAQLGASLLVEGVENRQDLYQSIKVGARYVQGFLFSEAKPELQPENEFEWLIHEEIVRYTKREMARYSRLFSAQENLNRLVPTDAWIGSSEDADMLIDDLAGNVDPNVVRIYICREDGCQISSNFTRMENGVWTKDEQFRGANWIWRPYFIPTMMQMKKQRQGVLSEVYADLDSSRPMQTYSCPVGGAYFLFFDLMIDQLQDVE